MAKKKASFWLALIIFSLMGQIAWVVENMYFNVFIYKTFNASASDISNMVAASAITATLTTVFMGALSDKIGKRKLFICLGYIFWGISIFSFIFLKTEIISSVFSMTVNAAALGVTLAIILDCVMTFFGSTANDAAFNAWLTDSTDNNNRGAAEGINAMMPLVAILVVFGGFMFFDLDKSESWTAIFSIIGILTLVIGVLGFFIIKEPKIKPSESSYIKDIFYGFRPSTIKENKTLYLVLIAFIVFNISIQIFMPYLIIYYEVSLGMADYVLVMAPAIIVASIVTAFWGRFYDKKGFRLSGFIGVLALIIGYIVLFLTRTKLPVFVGSLLMMSGYLSGMAVFGAMIRDNTPEGKSGRLQGVRIFSQVLVPGVIGPYIGKTILKNAETIVGNDGTASFVPNANIFLGALIAVLFILPFFFLITQKKSPRTVQLETDFEKDLTDIPFNEYPRPMMKRDSYLCLNGKWNFSIVRKEKTVYSGEILVPFVPESRISGVFKDMEKDDKMVYERSFSIDESFNEGKIILHFGACDQESTVFVNGKQVGGNVGGYLPFSFDISDYLVNGENKIKVVAIDNLDIDLAYGKQTLKRGGMWYTKISGIWQTVWLECVPEKYIEKIKTTPDLRGVEIEVFGGEEEKTILFQGNEYKFKGDRFYLEIENPIHWSPENPYLYDFSVVSGKDKIESYFGLRQIDIREIKGKSLICMNGKPYFFHGLLDQGYFSDGIFLPATQRGFKEDILKMKDCGFNMLRKHIKLEPDLFYYYCDKYGMIVFQDFINNGKYNFFIDTALPTIGLKSGISHDATQKRRAEFEKTSFGIIDALYNHPSVVYYTIFNEGWGQFDADHYYKIFKEYDKTRVYDATSGWFKEKESDVESDHIYFKPIKLKSIKGKPMVLSEFGGYSYKEEGHCFNLEENYGYKTYKDKKSFEDGLVSLYQDQVIPAIKQGLNATVLTQVSDVEDETNGLLTYDRRVLKVDKTRFYDLGKTLISEFDKEYGLLN